jgi:hypothetical protein
MGEKASRLIITDEDASMKVAILKDQRRQPEGGEWELIKILLENLAYIPKSTRSPSLLTRPRPHSYSKTIDLRNRVRDHNENTKQY